MSEQSSHCLSKLCSLACSLFQFQRLILALYPVCVHQITTCREKEALLHQYFNNHYSLPKGTKLCSGCITQDTTSRDHLSMGGRFRQVSYIRFLSICTNNTISFSNIVTKLKISCSIHELFVAMSVIAV